MSNLTKFQKIMNQDPLLNQVGGNHYLATGNPIKTINLINAYYGYNIATACKYITRYNLKNQCDQDITKVVHYMALHKSLLTKGYVRTKITSEASYQEIMDSLKSLSLNDEAFSVIALLLDWGKEPKQQTETKLLEKLDNLIKEYTK